MYYRKNAESNQFSPVKRIVRDSDLITDINKAQVTYTPYLQQQKFVAREVRQVSSDAIARGISLLPSVSQLVSLSQIVAGTPSIEEICIETESFIAREQLAKTFLEEEVRKLRRAYEQDTEKMDLARLITSIVGGLIAIGAVAVSFVASPAAGLLVAKLGGIALGSARAIIDEIENGIRQGKVDPDFLAKLGTISKDEYFYQKFTEIYGTKSRGQLRGEIYKTYEKYVEVLLIPEQRADRLINYATQIGWEITFSKEELINEFLQSYASIEYWGARSELEIILTVLCRLYEESQLPQATPTTAPTTTPTSTPPNDSTPANGGNTGPRKW